MTNNYTNTLQAYLIDALNTAKKYKNNNVEIVHLLSSYLKDHESMFNTILNRLHINGVNDYITSCISKLLCHLLLLV